MLTDTGLIPSTTGMLIAGDKFSFDGAATVFTVIEVIEDDEVYDDRLTLIVKPYIARSYVRDLAGDAGTLVLPTTYDRPVVRFPA